MLKNDSTNPADGQVSCAEGSRTSFSSYFLVRGTGILRCTALVVNHKGINYLAEGQVAMLPTLISLLCPGIFISVMCLLFNFPVYKTRWFAAILHVLKWFAGHQIRNVGVSWPYIKWRRSLSNNYYILIIISLVQNTSEEFRLPLFWPEKLDKIYYG